MLNLCSTSSMANIDHDPNTDCEDVRVELHRPLTLGHITIFCVVWSTSDLSTRLGKSAIVRSHGDWTQVSGLVGVPITSSSAVRDISMSIRADAAAKSDSY
eukprot:3761316-Pleurochrysis_carterae.AAC.1